jgi:NagD protein
MVDYRKTRKDRPVSGSSHVQEPGNILLKGELEDIRKKRAFICDMDGVIYHGNTLLPRAKDFVTWLARNRKRYLFLTNSSERSPRELQEKLQRLGVNVHQSHFYTSAMATAAFLTSQKPGGTVFVIGEAGLINALYKAGFSMNDVNPDFVVVGETRSYSFEKIEKAVHLVRAGAKLIGCNPDLTDKMAEGFVPATGALIAPIELASDRKAYFVGKPNPLMVRHALSKLAGSREQTVMIGDRMDTDIIAGIEAGIDTVLVLTGVTTRENAGRFAYRPTHILESITDLAT